MTPRIFFQLSGLSFVARYFVALCSNTHNKLKFSHVLLTFQAIARYCCDLQTKANMFCIIRAPSQTQSQRIVIHLARNAEKGGGVLMSIILPNLNHSFISLVPVPVPDSGSRFRFRIRIWISWFSIRPNDLWRHFFPHLHITKTWKSLKRKKIFQKGKCHSSLLWKAFQISSSYFLLHTCRHFKSSMPAYYKHFSFS